LLVSLIVTTRGDRVDRLERLLESLRDGDYKLFEVVVVSQDCSNLIAPLLREYQDSCRIKHLSHTRCSLSTARNIGLQSSAGRILGFPDDDCWYAADTLCGVTECFLADPEKAFVCTSVVDPLRRLPFGHKRVSKRSVGISVVNAFTFPISVGIFLNRLLIDSPLAFDERLGIGTSWGSGEETDLILSLLLDGNKGIFQPAITVYHEINYDREALFPVSKMFDYSRGFGAVIAKSIVRRKQYATSLVYLDLLARAVIRLALACVTFQKSSFSYQLFRAKGMLTGLFEGARYYAQQH
jgi:glycosyltransferase involved in cell wall biosynthesis